MFAKLKNSNTVWEAHPIKSWSKNPKQDRAERYTTLGKTTVITTFPESNIIRVVKYGKNLTSYGGKGKTHAKEFPDSHAGHKKALDYGLGKKRKVTDV